MEIVKKAKSDIILYSVLSLAGIIFNNWIIPNQVKITKSTKAEAFNPDTFPKAITLLFIVFGILGLLLAIVRYVTAVKKFGKPKKESLTLSRKNIIGMLMPYIIFLLVLAYILIFSFAGFIIASLLIPPIILYVIGCRKWKYFIIYYLFATLMYLIFVFILMVPIY